MSSEATASTSRKGQDRPSSPMRGLSDVEDSPQRPRVFDSGGILRSGQFGEI